MTFKAILLALALIGAPKNTASDVADAVLRNAKTPVEAAFLIAWADAESNFQRRIADNKCKPWECDRGLARGLWQSHRKPAGTAWDHLPGNIDLQAFVAVRHARWALKDCGSVRGAFRRLGGLACDKPLKGENERVATFQRVLEAMP